MHVMNERITPTYPLRIRALAMLFFIVMSSCSTSSVENAPSTPSPTPPMFVSPHDVRTYLEEHSPIGMGRDCTSSSDGLSCSKVEVPPHPGRYRLIVLLYADDFQAEKAFRESCHELDDLGPSGSGWWVIWQSGQDWYAEVSDDSKSGFDAPTPPVEVAQTLAEALGSSAWNSCSVVKSG